MLTLESGTPGALPRGRAPVPAGPANSEQWAHLWFTLAQHGWASLALVSAAAEVSALPLAERLAASAREYQEGVVHVFDASAITPPDVATVTGDIAARAAAGERVLIAVPSPLVRASAVPLARAADAALLVVPLGVTATRDARRVVAAVGHPHFLGSVTLQER